VALALGALLVAVPAFWPRMEGVIGALGNVMLGVFR
jgi:hypothetical protein